MLHAAAPASACPATVAAISRTSAPIATRLFSSFATSHHTARPTGSRCNRTARGSDTGAPRESVASTAPSSAAWRATPARPASSAHLWVLPPACRVVLSAAIGSTNPAARARRTLQSPSPIAEGTKSRKISPGMATMTRPSSMGAKPRRCPVHRSRTGPAARARTAAISQDMSQGVGTLSSYALEGYFGGMLPR